MICQICQKNPATVHVTEILHQGSGKPDSGAPSALDALKGMAKAHDATPEPDTDPGSDSGATEPTPQEQVPGTPASKEDSAPGDETEGTRAEAQSSTVPDSDSTAGADSASDLEDQAGSHAGSASNGGVSKSGRKVGGPGGTGFRQKHICANCAQEMNVIHMPLVDKSMEEVWKLLQRTTRKSRREAQIQCPDCGMTLTEFRAKGRFGCPKDYEIFQEHMGQLLQRMHNASEHTGRVPGLDETEIKRRQQLHDLRTQLESAIRDEAYESAAKLRDELKTLEESSPD